jgi:F0F1-type ATP synthase assembly protein I
LSQARGRRALLVVALATALVITPLVLLGVYLGYYVGGAAGYSKSVLAIAFSTAGFLAGMAVVFRVIRSVVAWTERARS